MQFLTSSLLVGSLFTIVDHVRASNSSSAIAHWLYTSEIDADTQSLLERPDIVGVQSLYSWKSLESEEDKYDFSAVHQDLDLVRSKGKLWIQVQDRSFSIASNPVPNYLHQPMYNNGSVPQCDGDNCDANFTPGGWVAVQWNEHVRARFQRLLEALATSFDGRIYGINLPETSIAVQTANNYTCQGYFEGELDNARFAASIFHHSYVVQYVNFWPCGWANEGGYLADSFAFFANHSIGIGGPDDIPYKSTQENNAYPYMSEYRDKAPISVIAVQEPDLAAINPNTSKPFTKQEFTDFATKQLGVDIIFWALSSPWLHQ
jgi:hypothetical protein